jgi:hypothetical protein
MLKCNAVCARSELVKARSWFLLQPGATDNGYSIGWLMSKPCKLRQWKRCVLSIKEIVGAVMRVHRDSGHAEWQETQKKVAEQYYRVRLRERCQQCRPRQTKPLPTLSTTDCAACADHPSLPTPGSCYTS